MTASDEKLEKTILVTGAASGIGRAICHNAAKSGFTTIALADIDRDRLHNVAQELEAIGAKAFVQVVDLADADSCAGLIGNISEHMLRLDAVVHSAAVARPAIPFLEYGTPSFSQDLAVNLSAGFVISRDAANLMRQQGTAGSIVFIASINAQGAGIGSTGYCVSKAGVVALMKVMAAELGEFGIRVNTVSPGPTDTPRSVSRVGDVVMQRLRERFAGAALRRLASPDEIADAVIYLCSDRASYVSGHDLVVDGGLTASVYVAAPNED